MKRLVLIVPLALAAIPCAFGYIGETIISGTQTIQVNHPDTASLQFYVNSQVASGAQSSLSGLMVITASSNPTAAIESSMASWNNVGSANIHFNALQTTNAGANSSDCQNVISIGSSAADLSIMGYVSAASPGVVGVTVNSFVQTAGSLCGGSFAAGSVFDSDILLNPYFQFSSDGTASTRDIQAVITHEFGHVLGMNHSGLLGATMYPYTAKSQRHLSWDEKAFAATFYPSGTKSLGTISGAVTLAGVPVKFALIVATDVSGGGKVIGGITGADGNYSIQVPPGVYNVYAEPFNSFIGSANIYSLSTSNGILDSTQVTGGFGATFSGGNTSSPPAFTITGSSSQQTANIAVTVGLTTIAAPYYGIGKANGNGDITVFSSLGGPITLVAGQSYDIGFSGAGIDSSISVPFIGTNVTLVGSPRIDTGASTGVGPIVRQTIQIGSQTTTTLGTLWIVKGTNVFPMSGILDMLPMAPFVNSAVDAESTRPSIVSGQYVALYGSNLATSIRAWNPSTDFTGGVVAGSPLPTSLDGVSITVNGQPASIYFTSPGQINFIAPSGLSAGPANIVVSNEGSVSATFTGSNIATASPSFFIYSAGTNHYPAAVHLDGTLVGDPALQPGSRKVLPGETILFFANGLGSSPGGVIVTAAGFSGTITMSAGSVSLNVLGAALVFAGEFQVNVTMPAAIAAGNYPLSMTVPGGTTATSGITVTLPVGP